MGKNQRYSHIFVKIHTLPHENDINSCFINISVDKFVSSNHKAFKC
jgi:hypothetical protein